MNAHTSIIDQNDLAQNLQQLDEEHEGSLRQIAIRRPQNDHGWFTSWLRLAPMRSGVRLWWLAPASWAVVFFFSFLVTDWIWDAFGQFLGRLEL